MRPWLKSSGWLVCWGGLWILVLKHWGPGWAAAGGICTLGALTAWCSTTMRVFSGECSPVRSLTPQVRGPRLRRVLLEEVFLDDPRVLRRVILEEEES